MKTVGAGATRGEETEEPWLLQGFFGEEGRSESPGGRGGGEREAAGGDEEAAGWRVAGGEQRVRSGERPRVVEHSAAHSCV